MQPNRTFLRQPDSFWACVRSLSQRIGYTARGTNQIKIPTLDQMCLGFKDLNLNPSLLKSSGKPTALGKSLEAYFLYRANVLNEQVEPNLMDAGTAKLEFDKLRKKLKPTCPIPMNKQKGAMRTPAYLTGMVNMLIEHNISEEPCDYDPRALTTITKDGMPVRTLARRVDGAFPSAVNPVAIWEIKEYYYTTSFGSRVADGVYESLLDGMELEALREHSGIDVKHYLFVDAHYTWWKCGRSYLCRMVDMLHMGYVDEVLFGKEIFAELPRIAAEWVKLLERQRLVAPSEPHLINS